MSSLSKDVARRRRGSAQRVLAAAVATAALIAVLWLTMSKRAGDGGAEPKPGDKPAAAPLAAFVAASNQPVFEAIRRDYEAATGVPLEVQYGASQTLLAQIGVAQQGDVYLPADDGYLVAATEQGLVAETVPLASMHAVVAVAKGNPKQIRTWDDLLRDDVRLAQAQPDAAAIGKLTREALQKTGRWDALDKKTTVYATNVAEAANNAKVGAVDAAIIYDSMLHDYDTLEAVRLPELAGIEARVAVAVLKTSRRPDEARAFVRYLSAADKGLARYREFGFSPAAAQAAP